MYSRKKIGRTIEPISIYVSIYIFMSNKEYAASAGETHDLFSQLVAMFNPVLNICLSRYKQRVISR